MFYCAKTLAALGAAGVPVPGAAAAASALLQVLGRGLELLLEHQVYLKSREALQKEE